MANIASNIVLHSCLLIVKSSFYVTGITGFYGFLELAVCMVACHVVVLSCGDSVWGDTISIPRQII